MHMQQMNAYFTTKDVNLNCVYYSKYPGYSRYNKVFVFTPLCQFGLLIFVVAGFFPICIFFFEI